MWYWTVTFGIAGGLAFIVGLKRFNTANEAVEDLRRHEDYIDDTILEADEGDIVNVEVVWKRER